jgi:maltooligosyltrehalose trehalohydrolase
MNRVQCADAQWNDDFHPGVHVLLTGQADGHYAAFADADRAHRAIARRGFASRAKRPPP